MPSITIQTDAETYPRTNDKTIHIGHALGLPGCKVEFYIHPKASERVLATARRVGHKIFQSPFAPLEYLGLEWKRLEADEERPRKSRVFDLVMFFYFKDIESQFAEEEDYREHVLPYLSRTRRISGWHQAPGKDGMIMIDTITLPFACRVPTPTNSNAWQGVSIKISDISAMQGGVSLETFAENVGLKMPAKQTYTPAEKAKMEDNYCNDPFRFEIYTVGDVSDLQKYRIKTNEFYNEIAALIDVEPSDDWGMSTGKIVGSMLHKWISKKLGLPVSKDPRKDGLYKINHLAGSEGITSIGRVIRKKGINYLAMVDGGRAVKERIANVFYGMLADIDIDGCYGNGLLNQVYAAGIPTITATPMTLREWYKKYKNQLVAGLWHARISWKDAPFKQDLLISKTSEKHSSWEKIVNGTGNYEDGNKVYDAGMVLTTNSVHQACLHHDALQAIQKYSSNKELNWLYDNAIIESSSMFLKKDEVQKVTAKMLAGSDVSDKEGVIISGTHQWVRVELKSLMSILLNARKQHAKGTPLNTFLKLIINTIYGCIASEFFSNPGACVSNSVVGNNITGRARVLAWCMAKGLHSSMSITDGGVYDANGVLIYKAKSLALFEQVNRDVYTQTDRHLVIEKVPLFGRELTYSELEALKTKTQEDKELNRPSELDRAAWGHLKSIFGELDIFKYGQFNFETKNVYTKLTLHSKVDYRLEKPDGTRTYAFRGMPKIKTEHDKKVIDPRVDELFDSVENESPTRLDIESTELLSLADWKAHPRADYLLPHDSVSKHQTFYSHTPHGQRHVSIEEYKLLLRRFEKAKDKSNRLYKEDSTEFGRVESAKLIAEVSRPKA